MVWGGRTQKEIITIPQSLLTSRNKFDNQTEKFELQAKTFEIKQEDLETHKKGLKFNLWG